MKANPEDNYVPAWRYAFMRPSWRVIAVLVAFGIVLRLVGVRMSWVSIFLFIALQIASFYTGVRAIKDFEHFDGIGGAADDSRRRFLRFTLRGLLVLVAVCAVTIWLALTLIPSEKAPLPPSVSISRLTAAISQSISDEEPIERFEVPESYYEPILKELKIALYDPKPKKWEGMGGLTITHADEQVLEIGLYLIRANDGWEIAYALNGGKRRYYRGGDAVALEKLIREAHQSQKEK